MTRGLLERDPRILVEAKIAASKMKHIDKDYERLWTKEDESTPWFIFICPRVVEVEPDRHKSQAPYTLIELGPLSLATREPAPRLALSSHRVISS